MSTASPTLAPSASSTTSAAPTASTSGSGDGGQGGTTSQSLLFFVALGFGVVFTNLWIIVGVKYCFRYNRRNRLNANNADPGDSIDLPSVQRPRRRREKKLMTMDEVNERFPLTKYKLWRVSREQEGLPAAGGVTAPPSRAASIKGVVVHEDHHHRGSGEALADATTCASADEKKGAGAVHHERVADEDDDDFEDEDPIRRAGPAVDLNQPGDSCAICIDNLEDDDEVRGLACGHAFHAGCIDPWLTGRRACCPLCKADYYVPKARDEGGGATAAQVLSMGGRSAVARPPRIFVAGHVIPLRGRVWSGEGTAPQTQAQTQTQTEETPRFQAVHWFMTIPQRLPAVRLPRPGMWARGGERGQGDLEAGGRRG